MCSPILRQTLAAFPCVSMTFSRRAQQLFPLELSAQMQGHEGAAKVGARFTYVGEVVAYEPDGDSGPEGSELGLDAIFRCSRAVSVASVIWRPYFYATCQVSLPPKEWEVVVPAVDDEVPAAFQSQAWNGEMLCTHCASLCGSYTPKRKYIFNHPIELHLDHSPLPPDAPTDPIPPRMIFQVLRMDAWERHFLEGTGAAIFTRVIQASDGLPQHGQLSLLPKRLKDECEPRHSLPLAANKREN